MKKVLFVMLLCCASSEAANVTLSASTRLGIREGTTQRDTSWPINIGDQPGNQYQICVKHNIGSINERAIVTNVQLVWTGNNVHTFFVAKIKNSWSASNHWNNIGPQNNNGISSGERGSFMGSGNGNGSTSGLGNNGIDYVQNAIDGEQTAHGLVLYNPAATNGTKTISKADLKVTYNLATWGDSNKDGSFNSSDIVWVFAAGTYDHTGNGPNADWGSGDWNGDGKFDNGDIIFVFQQGTYDQGPAALANALNNQSAYVP